MKHDDEFDTHGKPQAPAHRPDPAHFPKADDDDVEGHVYIEPRDDAGRNVYIDPSDDAGRNTRSR